MSAPKALQVEEEQKAVSVAIATSKKRTTHGVGRAEMLGWGCGHGFLASSGTSVFARSRHGKHASVLANNWVVCLRRTSHLR